MGLKPAELSGRHWVRRVGQLSHLIKVKTLDLSTPRAHLLLPMEDRQRPVTGYPAPGYPQPHSTTTTYPYNAPPPPYYNPNTTYHAPPYYSPRATFLRRFLVAMIAFFIISGTIIFIIWLILRPRLPYFTVSSASVSSFNASNSHLSGEWDISFDVQNPNKKMSISYERVESSISYKSIELSQTNIAPFYQGTKNETTVKASFAAVQAYVYDREINALNAERTTGSVSFTVKVLARVSFKSGVWKARSRFLSVLCDKVAFGLPLNATKGSLKGGPRECRVGL